jgi:hypothetical protein
MKILLILILSVHLFPLIGQKFDSKSYIMSEAKRLNFEKEVFNAKGEFEWPQLYDAGKKSIDNYFRMVSDRVALSEVRSLVRKGISLKDYYVLCKSKCVKGFKEEDMKDILANPENYLLVIPESGELKDVFVICDNTPAERKKYKTSEIANYKEIKKNIAGKE